MWKIKFCIENSPFLTVSSSLPIASWKKLINLNLGVKDKINYLMFILVQFLGNFVFCIFLIKYAKELVSIILKEKLSTNSLLKVCQMEFLLCKLFFKEKFCKSLNKLILLN